MIDMNINFSFKGSRNYVHGTDIFNKITENIDDDISKIDLAFHGISNKNLRFTTNSPVNKNDIKVIFKYKNDSNNQIILYGYENSSSINNRYRYNEDIVCNNSKLNIEQKEISLNQKTGFTFIENIVAMNKYLLENLFKVEGKWYFTRLQLDKPIHMINKDIKIRFKSNFNFKLTRSEIVVEDDIIGYIFFSLLQG